MYATTSCVIICGIYKLLIIVRFVPIVYIRGAYIGFHVFT